MALTAAIQILVDFAAAHVTHCSPDEQIKVYQALSETMSDPGARHAARELAEAISRVSALQLDFREILTTDKPQ